MTHLYAAKKPRGRKFHVFEDGEKFCHCGNANELEVLNQPHRDPDVLDVEDIVKRCADRAGLREEVEKGC